MTAQEKIHFQTGTKALCMTYARIRGVNFKTTFDPTKVTCKSCIKCMEKIKNSRPA
jgi:hypothetical protein